MTNLTSPLRAAKHHCQGRAADNIFQELDDTNDHTIGYGNWKVAESTKGQHWHRKHDKQGPVVKT